MALNIPSLQQLASGLPDEVQSSLRAALAAQDKLNRDIDKAINGLAQWNWLTPPLLNGWVNFAGQPARFTILETGQVHLEGGVASGTLSTAAFTLPVGYRPGQQCNFLVESNGGLGRLTVAAAGNVTLFGASNVYMSLCVTFLADG